MMLDFASISGKKVEATFDGGSLSYFALYWLSRTLDEKGVIGWNPKFRSKY
jgi:hypothetical protein